MSAVEDVASGEPVSTSTGFGGLVQVIPTPIVPEVPSAKAGPVIKSTETVPKETKETVSSEPTNPAAQPIEAEASKPPPGEAEANKPPSGEPETSKSTATASTSGNPEATPKAKAKSVSMRKPKAKEPPKETPEQKEEREKAERTAEELVRQEAEEKKKQFAKDAKSKKAAAENTEKAREAAAQQRKAKEQTAEVEQTAAQKRRVKPAVPVNDPEDDPPPGGNDQPWEIYHYRPHIQVQATLEYEGEARNGVRQYDLESVRGTRVPFRYGQATTVPELVKVLQHGNRRVRDIRAEQIERVAAARPIIPNGPHPCVVRGGLLMRVSTPYHKNGPLLLGTFPGMTPRKCTVANIHLVPTLGLTMEVDKPMKKPDLLTHLAIHTATAAIGSETKGNNARADNKADWFTPEVLRAARVFLKELSTAQYTNTGATAVQRPGFLYYPSELSGIVDEANKGRWVHLVSLGLQVSHIQENTTLSC